MAPKFSTHPFTQLFPLLIGIILILIFIGGYGFYAIQRDLLANSGQSLALAATDIADKINQLILERFEDLDFVSHSIDLRTQGPDQVTNILVHLKNTHPAFNILSQVNSEGRVVASIRKNQLGRDVTHIPGFKAIQSGQAHHLAISPSFDETQKGLSLILTQALSSGSRNPEDTLLAELPLSNLETFFFQTQQAIQQARHSQSRLEWQLLTNKGQILLDSILHEEGKVSLTKLDLPSALLVSSGKSGFIIENHKRRQVPVITGFAQTQGSREFPNPHWGVLLRIDQSDVLPAIHNKIFQLGAGISLVLIPLIGLIFLTIRKVESEHQQVLEAETKYRDIVENAQEGIFQTTPSGKFLSANPAMAKILGYDSQQDLINSGTDLSEQLDIDQDQRATLLKQIQIKGFIEDFETRFHRRDGMIRWISGNIRIVKDANGTIRHLEGTAEDITERKQAQNRFHQLQEQLLAEQEQRTKEIETELNKAKSTLITQAKLATLGQLSGSIAHELRNPLGAMRNAIFLLKRRVTNSDDQTKRYLNMLEEEIQNSDLIIQSLLEVARGKEPIKVPTSLQSLLDKVIQDKIFPDTVTLDVELETQPFNIWVDPQQFIRVLHNVLHNASQAMDKKGHIAIRGKNRSEMSEIEISDTGPGILKKNRKQLFDPLFTTKAKGTGLGLTLCRDIIERHGGTIISIDDKPEGGASFQILLPVYQPTSGTYSSDKTHHSHVKCPPSTEIKKKDGRHEHLSG